MIERISYLNGQFIPDSECKVHVTDRGFRAGDVVYDMERTFDGKIYRLREHLERLYRSLKYVRIDPGLTIDRFEAMTLELLERNEPLRGQGNDYLVNQFVSRGNGGRANDPVPPTVGIRVQPINFAGYARFYRTGAHVVIPRTRSYSAQSLDPKVKHYSRLNFALAELEATDVDPDAYPLLLDLEGNLSENISANFFIVTGGLIRTPGESNILQGVSRTTVFELARKLGIPATGANLQPYDAYTADEAFLATTFYCILPVGRVDNRPLGEKAPGPITRKLLQAWSELVGLDIEAQALSHI